MKKFINPILRVTTVIMLLSLIYHQHNQIRNLKKENYKVLTITHQYDSLKAECDSLRGEIFVKDIDLGRYHMIIDNLEVELDIQCKETLDRVLSQTE